MSNLQELEQLHVDYKALLDRRKMALRLASNRDFNKLILQEFCVSECARSVQISTDSNLDEKTRADALGTAQAAGYLKRFLYAASQMGVAAEREMPELEAALEEARAAEGNDDTAPGFDTEGGEA